MKESSTIYHPFNSCKLICHVNHWKQIKDGVIPPPILVTLDPINKCNFNCGYCNAAYKMKCSSKSYNNHIIDNIGLFLKKWGVKAICCAGGGEPLMHNRINDLLLNLHNSGIEIGLVTNGSLINRCMSGLSLCRWVGVSIDAGDSDTFARLKNVKANMFNRIIKNVINLRNFDSELEITYKFLAHPININSIYNAVKLAKEIGCNFFHLRPCGKTWDNLNEPNIFSKLDISVAEAQINQAREDFEDRNFRVFGIVHKFSNNWEIEHNFNKCYALAMTAVIEPDNYLGFCCDRRGDSRTRLGPFVTFDDILKLWNSKEHWDLMNAINLDDCPRCTYGPHNQIFENIILEDNVCRNFI